MAKSINESFPAEVGIVTALPVEFVPMKQMISARRPWPIDGDPNTYIVGYIPQPSFQQSSSITELPVVLTRLKRMGTNSAAAAATNLLRSFPTVRVVVMTGIACAVPNHLDAEKHVRCNGSQFSPA